MSLEPEPRKATTAEKQPAIHWLEPAVVIPGLPLEQEIYSCLAAVARVCVRWRPSEPQWESVVHGAEDQRRRLLEQEHLHSSISRPEILNALFGHFEEFPVYSAAVGVSFMQDSPEWACFATLLLWPYMAPRVLGYQVAVPTKGHTQRLGQFLRDAVTGKVSERQLKQAWAAWSALDSQEPPRVPGLRDPGGGLWKAISAYIQSYQATLCRSVADDLQPPSELEDGGSQDIEVIIDVLRMRDAECEGLSPEDANALTYSIGSGDDSADDGSDPLLRYFQNVHAGERAQQHLPLAWNRLVPPELAILRDGLSSFSDSARCGIALCISLSLAPELAAGLKLHQSFDAAAEAAVADGSWHLALTGGTVVGVHAVLHAPLAYRRTGSSPGWLNNSSVSVVGLPDFSSEILRASMGSNSGHVLRFLPELSRETRLAAESLRRKTSARLTFGRIREILADEIFRTSQDECLVIRTLPSSSIACGSGIYYSAYQATALYDFHRAAASSVMGWSIPELSADVGQYLKQALVGSELLIDPEFLRQAIDSLRSRAITNTRLGRLEPKKLVSAFNSQVMFTLAALTLMTNHRPTNEPFPRPADIQANDNLVLVVDKRQFKSCEQRLVPLTDNARAQYENLLTTIASTAEYLDVSAPAIGAQLRSLLTSQPGYPSAALFSVMELRNGQIYLRPFERSDWTFLWPEWIWPLNGNRHFLMQALNRLGMPREWASYLFGHAEIGQTAFNRHSTVSPDDYIRATSPALAIVEESLGIRPIPSIKAHKRAGASISAPVMLKLCLYGDAAPYRNRRRRLNPQERIFIKSLLRKTDGLRAGGSLLTALGQSIDAQYSTAPTAALRIRQLLRRWERMRVRDEA